MTSPTDAEVARRALPLLDLTDLSDSCDEDAIERLCSRAFTPHGHVAAVCVWPKFVAFAREILGKTSKVRIATVVNFPAGGAHVLHAVSEVELLGAEGANEIDLVMPYRAFAEGRPETASAMIAAVREAARARPLKVILETGMLRDPDLIRRAAELAIAKGADFVKTSTGKTEVSATPEAAREMLEAIKASGKRAGLKPSGGIRTVADARLYLDLADEIMGPKWVSPETFRFGASGLLDALLAAIDGVAAPAAKPVY